MKQDYIIGILREKRAHLLNLVWLRAEQHDQRKWKSDARERDRLDRKAAEAGAQLDEYVRACNSHAALVHALESFMAFHSGKKSIGEEIQLANSFQLAAAIAAAKA